MSLSLGKFVSDLLKYKVMLLIALLIFTAGIIMGAANSAAITQWVMPQIEKLGDYSRRLSQSNYPELSFFGFIFLNNSIKSVAIIFLGALFGLLPVFFLLMNGMALGFVVSAAGAQGQNVFELIVKGLLPHGIIEIPAILIASAFGLQFGYLVMKGMGEIAARDRDERTVEWRIFFSSVVRGICWIVILLLIAALVESTLTYYLMN